MNIPKGFFDTLVKDKIVCDICEDEIGVSEYDIHFLDDNLDEFKRVCYNCDEEL